MANTYTGRLKLAHPDAGDFNWKDEEDRNRNINDVVAGVALTPHYCVSGGVVTNGGGLNADVTAPVVHIGDTEYTPPAATLALTAPDGGEDEKTNWIYVDISGLHVSTIPPSGDYVPLALVDVDSSLVKRIADLRMFVPETGGSSGLQSIQVFSSSGTWTKPEGITKVFVSVCGGGGGGAGGTTTYPGGGGGGGGGLSIDMIDVSAISEETVTIGAGGAGGASGGGTGSTGGTTSFGAHCSATGGVGGQSSPGGINPGGAGGAGSGGDLSSGGGGGGSGDVYQSGCGGASYFGGGGGGLATGAAGVGVAGTAYGSGGGGAFGSANAGGAGKVGVVIVYEYK